MFSPLILRVHRNHVPWIIIAVCYVACMTLLLVIRWHLSRQNKIRDAQPYDATYDDVYIEKADAEGVMHKLKIDKVCANF